tara:strand:- start:373 stop:654 length:282 start_codon:yes stop_codon:yes gene_type:complete
MELTDLIKDIEGTKLVSIGFFGVLTGAIAGVMNKKDLYKESTKGIISAIGGLTSVDYTTTYYSKLGQASVYIAEFRLAYEIGQRLSKKYYRRL